MVTEIINTGSELMLGYVLNTNHQWLSRQLADLGIEISRQVAVPDRGPDIQAAVREALARADLIITTGGLGPTSDDLTRDLIARLLGRELREDPAIVAHIEQFFAARNRPMPPSTRVQALVPEGAIVLPNAHGTAPGLAIEVPGGQFRLTDQPSLLIMLPGPPRELQPMFLNSVLPLLRQKGFVHPGYACRVFRSTGLGESLVEQRIAQVLAPFVSSGLEIGYCSRTGEVDLRLIARGPQAEEMIAKAEAIVRNRIGKYIFGLGEQSLESVVIQRLTQAGRTLAVAESCTGGLLSHRLTNVPGASAVFLGGLVTYSNAAKQRFLGVREETLRQFGAVSEEVAREMAEGVRESHQATFGIGITGIAGPSGGTPEKPVGTVFVSLAGGGKTAVFRFANPYDRETFKQVTTQQALEILRRRL